MGVVKNLMVRIGADVRGVVGGMKTAYSATRQTTSQIKSATSDMKRSVRDSFSGSRMSIREYKETVDRLETSHNTAVQNTKRLRENLQHMKGSYASLKSALAGLDLSKPLTAQIQEAEQSWHGFLNEAQKVKEALRKEMNYSGDKDNSQKIANLRKELDSLREKANEARLELQGLQDIAESIGPENLQFASASGLDEMLNDILKTEQELEISGMAVDDLAAALATMNVPELVKIRLKAIGSEAWEAAKEGVAKLCSALKEIGKVALNVAVTGIKKLGNGLKAIGGTAMRTIAALPGKLASIGKGASSGCSGLERMVRSIRNIGIVSLGMRAVGGIFRGVFGELQGIVSNYISQNEQLNATISNLKAQLGQALAPAINAIVAAMQRLMPVIQTIAGVINSIFTALFGKVKTTTSGIKSSTAAAKSAADQLETYSFDQITKVSDKSEDSAGVDTGDIGSGFDFGATPPWLENVLSWIEQMKEAFKAGDWEGLGRIFGEGINAAVDAINAVDIGTKVGTFVNNLFTTLNSALKTIDFYNVGKKVGEFFTSGIQQVNWNTVGETIGRGIIALPQVLVGIAENTNWDLVGKSIGEFLAGALKTVGGWIKRVNWFDLGRNISDLINGVNWANVGQTLSDFLSAALNAAGDYIKGIDWFQIGENIETFIGNIDWAGITESLMSGFGSALGGIASAIWAMIDDEWQSVVDWWHDAAYEDGQFTIEGLLKGIWEKICNIGTWVKEHLVDPFIKGFDDAFEIHSPSKVMKEKGVHVISGFLAGILEGLGDIGSWVGKHIVSPFLKWIGSLFGISGSSSVLKDTGKDLIGGFLDGMTEAWNAIDTFLESKITGLETRFTQGWTKIKQSTTSIWKEITMAVSDRVKSMQATTEQQVETMRQRLIIGWSNIRTDGVTYLSELVSSVKTGFQTMRSESVRIFNELRSEMLRIWSNISAQLASTWNTMSSQFEKVHTRIKSAAVKAWTDIHSTIKSKTDGILASVETFRTNISGRWTSMLNELADATRKIAAVIGEGFSNMLRDAQNVLKAIISGVTEMASAIVRSVTSAMEAINKLGSARPSSSPSDSGSSSSGSGKGSVVVGHGGSVSTIPGGGSGGAGGTSMHLATGGVTTGPTRALIGEAGKEAVIPLERNTSWMDTLGARLATFVGGGNAQSLVFKFYLGGKKISQHVISDINSITQTTGVCPIKV